MSAVGKARALLRSRVGVIGILVVLALLVMYLIAGRGFGLLRLVDLLRAVMDSRSVSSYSLGDFTNVVFLHHSTGHNLIEQGGVRERFTAAGYDFWDHGYNPTGLRNAAGEYTGYSYNIPGDNTDPDGLARIFTQRPRGLPLNAFSGLLQHEVIAFKSCYPASQITSDEQLAQYKAYYLAMRDVMDQHPDRVFIVMSPPPLNPAATDAGAAARARAFAEWLQSEEYLAGHPNVFAFDLFGHLAEGDPASPDYNMLRAEYRPEGEDSHPNAVANETVGPLLADFVMRAAEDYKAIRKTGITDASTGL
jgi:hypothetical protein